MGYVGLLAAALIVCILFVLNFKSFTKGPQPSTTVKEAAVSGGINASSYQTIVGDIRGKLNATSQQEKDKLSDLEGMK